MNLSKIRLVVSDMDGTLLNSKHEVSPRFFELFKQLQSLGITFVAASGRQYYSIIDKLHAIKDDIIVIAENGALTMQRDQELQTTALDFDTYLEVLNLTSKIEGSQTILCGRDKGYFENHGDDFTNLVSEFYARYQVVDNLSDIDNEQYLKLAICNRQGSEKHIYPHVKHLEDRLKIKVSGEIWLDISHQKADKGNALQQLQEQLNIPKEETMAFGDFNNDLEMLSRANFSFAMENAHPNITKAAKYQTKSNNDYGVERILEKLVEAKKAL